MSQFCCTRTSLSCTFWYDWSRQNGADCPIRSLLLGCRRSQSWMWSFSCWQTRLFSSFCLFFPPFPIAPVCVTSSPCCRLLLWCVSGDVESQWAGTSLWRCSQCALLLLWLQSSGTVRYLRGALRSSACLSAVNRLMAHLIGMNKSAKSHYQMFCLDKFSVKV